jgi:predicted component of type VI protein secretion system
MHTTFLRFSTAVSIAATLAMAVTPLSSEAKRVRIRSHHSSSTQETQQPAQPTQKQLEDQAAAAARTQRANDEAREKRAAEMKERNAANDAKMKEIREARLDAQRKRIEAAHAKRLQKEAPAVAEVSTATPKSAPLKMTSYKDENGVTHFTDGTDAASQTRSRSR